MEAMLKEQSPADAVPSIDVDALEAKFTNRDATIAILGMGYVGLPLALSVVNCGLKAVGLDIDASKIEALRQSKTYISHIPDEALKAASDTGRFIADTDFSHIKDVDAILVCVPTPLDKYREPDLSYVVETTKVVVPHLREGQLYILESTTWPGTTREVLIPILEESGLKAGENLFVAYSPEREDPGNKNFGTTTIPKVVGGNCEASRRLACAMYNQFVTEAVPVSSADTAEAVKLTENIFRSINIALVNELKVVYDAMGIDVWEVIDAAATKPFGFMPFYPGPGLGGHCIPIDPFYLTWRARAFELPTRFIELAGEIINHMPHYVVQKLSRSLDQKFSKGLNGSKILVLGMAYKKDVDDMRESPSLKLIELLEERGAACDYHDDFFKVVPMTREHAELAGRTSIDLTPEALESYDCVLIATDHSYVDYKYVVKHAKMVVDSRNATEDVTEGRDKIVKA